MVYTVSDRRARAAANEDTWARPAARRLRPGARPNWPRIIAVCLNVLAWIAIIAVGRRLLHG